MGKVLRFPYARSRLFVTGMGKISRLYTLQKLGDRCILLLMEANSYFDLALGAEREACIAFRKSLLMLASNFLVGTFFNSSRLASTGELL
jgi:hypothetical protein